MSEIEQLQQKVQELNDERDIFARTLDKRDHEIEELNQKLDYHAEESFRQRDYLSAEIERLRKELNRTRDAVDLWANEVNILEFENKRLRGLLYEAFSTKNR
jgi:uncharacterized coiled-coil DUF342 family protein